MTIIFIPTPTPIPLPTIAIPNCDTLQKLIQSSYLTECGGGGDGTIKTYDVRADLNKDQKVNGADFSLFSFISSLPNKDKECALKLGDNNQICPWANQCAVLYGKIINGYLTSCSASTVGYKKYDKTADLNKDGQINGADMSLFSTIKDKTNYFDCQTYLNKITDPCKKTIPTQTKTIPVMPKTIY